MSIKHFLSAFFFFFLLIFTKDYKHRTKICPNKFLKKKNLKSEHYSECTIHLILELGPSKWFMCKLVWQQAIFPDNFRRQILKYKPWKHHLTDSIIKLSAQQVRILAREMFLKTYKSFAPVKLLWLVAYRSQAWTAPILRLPSANSPCSTPACNGPHPVGTCNCEGSSPLNFHRPGTNLNSREKRVRTIE